MSETLNPITVLAGLMFGIAALALAAVVFSFWLQKRSQNERYVLTRRLLAEGSQADSLRVAFESLNKSSTIKGEDSPNYSATSE